MANKINITFLADTISCDTAGTQKQLLEIVKRLGRDRFNPHITCLHSSPWMEGNELPCPLTILGYRGFLKPNFLQVVSALRRIVCRKPVHILHTFFEDSIFVAYLATMGLNGSSCVLLSSRRDMGLGYAPWYHRLFPLVLPLVNRHFDGIVSNGQEIRKWVAKRERVPMGKIHVIPNGTHLPASPACIPELFKKHPSPLWIGLVASLTPVKRIDVFLRALRIVREKRPDLAFQALILGEGPLRDDLLALAQQENMGDRVHFPGAVKDVSPYLHQLHVGVLCSDREGFPNAVLEYMAHSLPVVVTRTGGNAELVDSATGLCVPTGDHESLAMAMIRLADDPSLRASLGRAGRGKVDALYSWERSMAELEDYYLHKLSEKGLRW